jgi:deazaflavin-dependent oxidoreductase (nitroreductase family)
LGTRFASSRAGSWTVRKLTPLDRRILLRSGGRRTVLGPIGAPTLLLETVGRRTGQRRVNPLLFARDPDGESVIVVGSNFGQQHHPGWTSNLIASPHAVVKVRGTDVPVTATLLEGVAAESAYQRMVAVTAVYAAYRTRTDRRIRVFRLTPEPAQPTA